MVIKECKQGKLSQTAREEETSAGGAAWRPSMQRIMQHVTQENDVMNKIT